MRKLKLFRDVILLIATLWVASFVLNRYIGLPYPYLIIALIDLSIVLASFKFLYQFERRTPKPTEDTYYPPDCFDPAQAGYVMDGFVDDGDIMGLLPMWGNLGYLRIYVSEGKTYLVKLKKITKNYAMSYRELFSSLFPNGSQCKETSELYLQLYPKVAEAKSDVESYFDTPERHIYYLESLALQKGLSVMLMIPLLLNIIAVYFIQFPEMGFSGLAAILFVSGSIAVSATIPLRTLIQIMYHWIGLSIKDRIKKTLFVSIYTIGFLGLFIAYAYTVLPELTIFSSILTLALIAMTYFSKRRTWQGAEWLDRLLGLKEFIREAPKDAITRLVAENSDYYYDVLPYAYVLGISRKWSEHFDEAGINVLPCHWFENMDHKAESAAELHHQMEEALENIKRAIMSRPEVKLSRQGRY